MIIDAHRDGVYLWTDSNVTSIKGRNVLEVCKDIYSRVVQPRETVDGKVIYDQLYELHIDVSGIGMQYKKYLTHLGLVVHDIRPKNIDIILPVIGTPCIIAQQIKKQKKTSRYKIINWFYKKIYGYEYESILPEGLDIVYSNGALYFKDKETFNRMAKAYE